MKLPRATWVVVALSLAGGAAALAVAAWSLPSWAAVAGRQWPAAVVTGLLMAGSWTWPVLVYRGTESEAVHLDEGFFVLLSLLVPPVLTLGTLALATTAAQAARRRRWTAARAGQRSAPARWRPATRPRRTPAAC